MENEITESTSSSFGKTVNESKENTSNKNTLEEKVTNKSNTTNKTSSTSNTKSTSNNQKKATEVEKDPTFQIPLKGEILKDYSKDSLVYSDTLKEWTTHLGIDIKAERASVVKASADGA